MMNGSTYGGVNISTSETYNDSDSEIIIYDDDFEEETFVKKYDFSIEELVSRLSPEDQQSFYDLIDKKQKRGKPTKEVQAKKQELYGKLRTIKEELKDDQ